jgi:hypothetical protein
LVCCDDIACGKKKKKMKKRGLEEDRDVAVHFDSWYFSAEYGGGINKQI